MISVVTPLPGNIEGGFRAFDMDAVVTFVHELRDFSKMIGGEPVCGAVVYYRAGGIFGAAGCVDSHAVRTALADARMMGVSDIAFIAISVPDNMVENPLPDDALMALSDLGEGIVLLVGDDRSIVFGTVLGKN